MTRHDIPEKFAELALNNKYSFTHQNVGGHRGRDRMVVGLMQSVPITGKVLSSNPAHGKVYSV